MGGNLLSRWGLPPKRISPKEYQELHDTLLMKFWEESDFSFDIAPSLKKKESHGDLDIIASSKKHEEVLKSWWGKKGNKKLFLDYIKDISGGFVHKNSNVISFPVNGFQVDLTFVEWSNFNSTIQYNSWGDCGNLMGRVFHKLGLSYGHTGLSFWIREGLFSQNTEWSNNDHICSKHILTQDFRTICEIGGFSYERWDAGFDTEEEVFEFISNSTYFHKDLFSFENLNHINRVRNKKRSMYSGFITWIEKNKPANKIDEFPSKENFSLYFQGMFPHLRAEIDKSRYEYQIKSAIKRKINGGVVMEILNLESGPLISAITKEVLKLPTEKILLCSNKDIREIILKSYSELQKVS